MPRLVLQVFLPVGNKRENWYSKLVVFAHLNEFFCMPFKMKATTCRIVPLMKFILSYKFSPIVAVL